MKNILLIFGGDSAESEISIVTAKQIEQMKTQDISLFCVLLRNKNMYLCKYFDIFECVKDPLNKKIFLPIIISNNNIYYKKNRPKIIAKIDGAIIATHGGSGENGELVSFLKMNDIPCSVGNNLALGVAMDKVISKAVFKDFNIPVVDSFWFYKHEWDENREGCFLKAAEMGYPLCIKPARQGSSVGIGFVKSESELEDAVELALEFDDKILVEKGLVDFRELNVSVISDGEKVMVSELEEPIRASDILSFADKYLGGGKGGSKGKMNGVKCEENTRGMEGSYRKFPAEVEESVSKKVKDLARRAAECLELYGVTRFDFLLHEGNVYLNEINAVPGSLSHYFWGDTKNFFNTLVKLSTTFKTDKKVEVAKFLK